MDKPFYKSTRLYVTIFGIIVTILNKKLDLQLSDSEILSLTGIIGSYVCGRSATDVVNLLKKSKKKK